MSLAGPVITQALADLSSTLDNSNKRVDVASVAKSLHDFVVNDLHESDLALTTSLLFNDTNGIADFLERSLSKEGMKPYASAREDLLVMLAMYIQKYGMSIQDHLLSVKDSALKMYLRDETNGVKDAALAPIKEILELKLPLLDAETLKIKELVQMFMKDLQNSKMTQTVRGSILRVLGLVAAGFPDYFAGHSQQLLTNFVTTFEKQFASKKPEMQLIAGALHGLCSYLRTFPLTQEKDPKLNKQMYGFITLALTPPPDLKRFEIPRLALQVVAEHAWQWRQCLTEDCDKKMYDRLILLCQHGNSEVRNFAYEAMDSFVTEVSKELVSGSRSEAHNHKTFTYLVSKFWQRLDDPTAPYKDIAMAVRAVGRLGAPVRLILGDEELDKVVNKLLRAAEKLSSGETEQTEDTINQLPSFIVSLASIMSVVPVVTDSYLDGLEKLISLVFLVYPSMWPKQRDTLYASINQLFGALFTKGTAIQVLLRKTIFPGLALTAATQLMVQPRDKDRYSAEKIVPYAEYLRLWMALLDPKNATDAGISAEQVNELHCMVYDAIIEAAMRFVTRLDLSTCLQQEKPAPAQETGDGSTAAGASTNDEEKDNKPKPRNPQDFSIFLNLVSFLKLFLPVTRTEMFLRWIYVFMREMIILANANPEVSGFYKLLTMAMRITSAHDIFAGLDQEETGEPMEDTGDAAAVETTDGQRAIYVMGRNFVKELLVRLQQCKDELLASAVEFVLSVPKELATMRTIVPAMQTAFTMGLSYTPLAMVGLDAMEYWLQAGHAEFKAELPKILPCLNDYLFKVHAESGATADDQALKVKKTRSTTTYKGFKKEKQKVVVETNVADSTSLQELQPRILRMLGGLGGDVHGLVGDLYLEDSRDAIKWDTQNRVGFKLKFGSMNPVIYFDALLPRIVSLAESATDRQTKTAACEALHSLVLYMVGSTVHNANNVRGQCPYNELFKHIFPSIVKLATDPESVARQLFQPLVFQLIHLLTNRSGMLESDTKVMLETIITCLGDPNDGSKREFAALCIAEFMKWSIKQSTKKDMTNNPIHIDSLFRRLEALAVHPNAHKRLGAALAFTNFYRDFREEKGLVERFVLHLVDIYLRSLRLADKDDKFLQTTKMCTTVLRHLVKIIEAYSSVLQKELAGRSKFKKLDDLIEELYQCTGALEADCRHLAMELFSSLTHNSGRGTKGFLEAKGVKTLQQTAEANLKDASCSLLGSSHLQVSLFYRRLLLTLDNYVWILEERHIAPDKLLAGSEIWRALDLFLSEHAMTGRAGQWAASMTPSEVSDLLERKCTVLVRVFEFARLLWADYPAYRKPETLSSEALVRTLVACVLQPSSVGFSTDVDEIQIKLPKITAPLLIALVESSDAMKKRLEPVVKDQIRSPEKNLQQVDLNESKNDVNDALYLLRGYDQLLAAGLLLGALGQNRSSLAGRLAQNALSLGDEASPMKRRVAAQGLKLAFGIGYKPEHLLDVLKDDTKVTPDGQEADDMDTGSGAAPKRTVPRGQMFYAHFVMEISHYIVGHPTDILVPLIDAAVGENERLFSVLLGAIEYAVANKSPPKKLLDLLLPALPKLQSWAANGASLSQQQNMLDLVTRIANLDSDDIRFGAHPGIDNLKNLFVQLLHREKPLAFKDMALTSLPVFLQWPENKIDPILRALADIIAFNFPLHSTDLAEKSIEYIQYSSVLNKMLIGLEKSHCLPFIEVLLPIFREREHRMMPRMLSAVSKFIATLSNQQAKSMFELCYQTFKDSSHTLNLRHSVLENMCVPIFNSVLPQTAESIALDTIGDIMGTVTAPLPRAGTEQDLELAFLSKIGSYKLLTAIFQSLDVARVIKGNLTAAVHGEGARGGNDLVKSILKHAHATKQEKFATSVPLRLAYHQAAYMCLMTVIRLTQEKEDVFATFLFKENLDKNEFIWENIVDLDEKHEFEVETEFALAKASVIRKTQTTVGSQQKIAKGSDRYVSTQYLSSSSIASQRMGPLYNPDDKDTQTASQAASQTETDNNNASASFKAPLSSFGSMSETMMMLEDVEGEAKTREEMERAKAEQKLKEERDLLELDDINRNPVMPMLLELLDLMVTKFGTPTLMPKWIETFRMALAHHHVNVKVFAAKVIINRMETFGRYSVQFLPLIMDLIVGPNGGRGFHYFLRDLVNVILEWKVVPEDIPKAGAVVVHLMSNTLADKRPILKANLEAISHLVALWKSKLSSVSKRPIIECLEYTSEHESAVTLRKVVGLQLLAVLVNNGMSPYTPDDARALIGENRRMGERPFYALLVECLKYKSSRVHECAAETIGMIFRKQTEHVVEDHSQILTKPVEAAIDDLLRQGDALDKVVNILYRIGQRSPAFLDQYYPRIFHILRDLKAYYKVAAIEMIGFRAANMPDLWQYLKPLVNDLLTDRDSAVQLHSLIVVRALLKRGLDVPDIRRFLKNLSAFSNHKSVSCRAVFYECLQWLYDNQPDLKEEPLVLVPLLQALSDKSRLLRSQAEAFWNDAHRLRSAPHHRLEDVLAHLYNAETENNFLHYATFLVIAITRLNIADYNDKLFEELESIAWGAMVVDPAWRGTSAQMTPLYSQLSQESMRGGGLRATQVGNNMFSMTQQQEEDEEPVINPTFAESYGAATQDNARKSSLLFRHDTASFSQLPATGLQEETSATQQMQDRFRRRFMKRSDSEEKSVMILRNLKRKKVLAAVDRTKATSEEKDVQIYRKYRKGDLPDVAIHYHDVIRPLEALAIRDAQLARLLFHGLFKSIYQELERSMTSTDTDATQNRLKGLLMNIFNSTKGNTSLVGTAQDICRDLDIEVLPKVGSAAAMLSFNYHGGIMLLESQLLKSLVDTQERPAKRPKKSASVATTLADPSSWIELAKLNKEIDDVDTLRSILKSHVMAETEEALDLQIISNYAAAYKKYEDLLRDKADANSDVLDLISDESISCLIANGQWKDAALVTFSEDLYLPTAEVQMGMYIRAASKTPERYDELLNFIGNAPAETKARLEAKFSVTMAICKVVGEDLDQARHFVDKAYGAFIVEWSEIHPLAIAAKHNKLRNLEIIHEIDQFLNFVGQQVNFTDLENLGKFCDRAAFRSPSMRYDDVLAWDDVIQVRQLLLQRLEGRYNTHLSSTSADRRRSMPFDMHAVRTIILESRIQCLLTAVEAAREMNEPFYAERLLLSNDSLRDQLPNKHHLGAMWTLEQGRVALAKTEVVPDVTVNTRNISHLLGLVRDKKSEISAQLLGKYLTLEGDVHMKYYHLLCQQDDGKLRQHSFDLLPTARNSGERSLSNIRQVVRAHALGAMEEAVANMNQTQRVATSEALAKYAVFCESIIRAAEDEASLRPGSAARGIDGLPAKVVESVLKSMALENSVARDRFPRLLQLLNDYPEVASAFQQEVEAVPEWMFIRWISQLLGVLDQPNVGPHVVGILVKIARAYPQAIYFNWRVSSEGLSKFGRTTAKPLEDALPELKQLKDFTDELDQLTNPEHRYKDTCDWLKAEAEGNNYEKAMEQVRKLKTDVLNANRQNVGSAHVELCKTFAPAWTAFKENNLKDCKQILTAFKSCYSEASKIKEHQTNQGLNKLIAYSPWLAHYSVSDPSEAIELPGQYTGVGRPSPEYHVTVVNFDPTLLVLGSIRKPKRLTVRGNDEREHRYLVKGGEDLRQDQRVEQLFGVMNEIMRRDRACASRHLSMRTYQVVPLTVRLGILEWMSNTQTLKSVVEGQILANARRTDPHAQKIDWSDTSVNRMYYQWINSHADKTTDKGGYLNAYRKDKRSTVEEKYGQVVASIGADRDALKDGVLKMAASAEAWIAIRSEFISSCSVISICSYIIGIGDRHMDNLMLDTATGKMVTIDFGHAFGSALLYLPVPELMPFRLTPMFEQFMAPHDPTGQFNYVMRYALSALRANRDVILNVMDVFVNEPLLDWKKFAKRHTFSVKEKRELSESVEMSQEVINFTWFPKLKIKMARKKLEGGHSGAIMAEELKVSVHAEEDKLKFAAVTRGQDPNNKGETCKRARLPDSDLSVADQVACLIDHATDKAILGRTWIGWAPYY